MRSSTIEENFLNASGASDFRGYRNRGAYSDGSISGGVIGWLIDVGFVGTKIVVIGLWSVHGIKRLVMVEMEAAATPRCEIATRSIIDRGRWTKERDDDVVELSW